MTVEEIARVCHEANRAYCLALGDDSQKSWEEAEQWQRDSAIKGVQFRADKQSTNLILSPNAQHDKWMEDKLIDGWKYGPVKDAEKKEHPCLLPYHALLKAQQLKDALFIAVADALLPKITVYRP